MNKIQFLSEARIYIDNGYGEVHISEQSDNAYNISISEYAEEKLRIGIPFPDGGGTLFMNWKKVKKIIIEHEYGKKDEKKMEKEPEKDGPGNDVKTRT